MIDTWLRGDDGIAIRDEASISMAREEVRSVAARLGFPLEVGAAIATATSELGYNQLKHALHGEIVVREIERDGVAGVEIVAADRGAGIADPEHALHGVGSSSGGLGVGLHAVRTLADEVDFDVRLGEGTCVWARKFATRVRRRREVGVFGRPHPDERVSGDHAAFVRSPGSLAIAVADGLGHGQLARTASSVAITRFVENAERTEEAIFEICHSSLRDTRGAVMAVAHIAEPDGTTSTASVGNVSAYTCGPSISQRFGGASFVLGSPGQLRAPRTDHATLTPRDAMLLFSDGISSRAHCDHRFDLLREHPIVIAQTMMKEFGRDDDDVIVLATR